ncbi:hypothetical protein [Pseudoalteromonas tunicata]|nr:hypothetical protein [Pseudoalteromonas tunicata]ATC93855.1 hypothetical protein PTUN_a1189 [Pseudoalteromonas tunicata]
MMKVTPLALFFLAAVTSAQANEQPFVNGEYEAAAEYYREKQINADYYKGFINTLNGYNNAYTDDMQRQLIADAEVNFKNVITNESQAQAIGLDTLVCEQYQENNKIYACAAEISMYQNNISFDDDVLINFLFDSFTFEDLKNHLVVTKACNKTEDHCKIYSTMIYRQES